MGRQKYGYFVPALATTTTPPIGGAVKIFQVCKHKVHFTPIYSGGQQTDCCWLDRKYKLFF
jgi:hypothetical protein